MSDLQKEIVQCLNYFGPMSFDHITKKMDLRKREIPLTPYVILQTLAELTEAKKIRFSNGVYVSQVGMHQL